MQRGGSLQISSPPASKTLENRIPKRATQNYSFALRPHTLCQKNPRCLAGRPTPTRLVRRCHVHGAAGGRAAQHARAARSWPRVLLPPGSSIPARLCSGDYKGVHSKDKHRRLKESSQGLWSGLTLPGDFMMRCPESKERFGSISSRPGSAPGQPESTRGKNSRASTMFLSTDISYLTQALLNTRVGAQLLL